MASHLNMVGGCANPSPRNPDLLTEIEAAEYLGRAVYWLQKRRTKDNRRAASGQPTIGPRWLKEKHSGRVLYSRAVLDEWLGENLEPFPPTAA